MKFTKAHGTGNDFIILDGILETLPKDLEKFAIKSCQRPFGLGADQMLVVLPSQTCDFRMDIYNCDGTRVEMCGNGIRSFVKYLLDAGHTTKNDLKIETLAGVICPKVISYEKDSLSPAWIQVDMGEPILEADKIPTLGSGKLVNWDFMPSHPEKYPSSVSLPFHITTVSMGNPHCVIFVENVDSYPVREVGALIEVDPFFPKKVNVEFVQVLDKKTLRQRTFERGAGETYSCGTGASAVCVASTLNGHIDRECTIQLKGGDLKMKWDESSNHVFKTGPAVTVAKGDYL
jgi:diaminopimelate epimerase